MPEDHHQQSASNAPTQKPAGKSSQISRKFSISVCLLLLLAMCVFWLISNYTSQNLLRQQADSHGQVLAQQVALQVTELVLANDMISMNVVLNSLTRGSSIAEVAIINIDNEIIAAASGNIQPSRTLIPLPVTFSNVPSEYRASISIQDSTAGYVRILMDVSYIEAGIVNTLLLIAAATLLLLIVAVAITSTYFQYLVSFPANLLSFALSNIRTGKIETCPEPENNNEISAAIRQYNSTAEFLAQNAFLDNFGMKKPTADEQSYKIEHGTQDVTLLTIKMGNFHYLASTLSEEILVNLLNKYYFFAGKVSQLYNGSVNYCAEDEIVINFSSVQLEEEQAFHAICAGQLFQQLIADLNDVQDQRITAKFKLAVHSGKAVSGLYSPVTQETNNITGKTLDTTRQICAECPDNSLLISEPCFQHAGAGARIEAQEYAVIGDDAQFMTYISTEPMSDYSLLLERQAIQLVTLYSD